MAVARSTGACRLLTAVLVAVSTGLTGAGQSPPPQSAANTRAVETLLARLQRAVDSSDRRAVSALVRYPATLLASGFNIPISGPSELIRLYDLAFPPELRCAIVNSRVGGSGKQAPKLSATGDGVSIASGLVWAQKDGEAFKITRIISPPATMPRHARREPRRAVFLESKAEPPTARYSGILERDDVDVYLVSAKARQQFYIGIDGFRGRDVELRVLEDRNSPPLKPTTGSSARVWSGRIQADGEYRVEVVRRAPFCGPSLLYTIVMTLR